MEPARHQGVSIHPAATQLDPIAGAELGWHGISVAYASETTSTLQIAETESECRHSTASNRPVYPDAGLHDDGCEHTGLTDLRREQLFDLGLRLGVVPRHQ